MNGKYWETDNSKKRKKLTEGKENSPNVSIQCWGCQCLVGCEHVNGKKKRVNSPERSISSRRQKKKASFEDKKEKEIFPKHISNNGKKIANNLMESKEASLNKSPTIISNSTSIKSEKKKEEEEKIENELKQENDFANNMKIEYDDQIVSAIINHDNRQQKSPSKCIFQPSVDDLSELTDLKELDDESLKIWLDGIVIN